MVNYTGREHLFATPHPNATEIFYTPPINYWALTDEEIDAMKYQQDDDAEYQLEVAGRPIPTFGVVLLIVLLSALIGAALFLCSYYHERRIRPYTKEEDSTCHEADDLESQKKRHEIERRLKLKVWENTGELVMDESSPLADNIATGNNDDGGDQGSVVSAMSQGSILMQDPSFVRLQQKPRCVLCSKIFTETDTVTESWDPACAHNFHKDCIVSWLQKKEGCPLCKSAYVVGVELQKSHEDTVTHSFW